MKYGSTRKEQVKITNFKDLAEVWFVSYETWASSENTLNRVQGYLSTYIIPRFGEYQPNIIEPSDIQI
ncbi:site-specific integrase, partial [Lactococcus lactis]